MRTVLGRLAPMRPRVCFRVGTIAVLGLLALVPPASADNPSGSRAPVRGFTLYSPELGQSKRLWVRLPPDYGADPARRHPVVYMQDGQFLFDPRRTRRPNPYVDEALDRHLIQRRDWYGSWALDRRLATGTRAPPVIVVGVSSAGTDRMTEYSPWPWREAPLPEGEAYARFLAATLKPWVDRRFATLPGREHTAVAGSSMGGLVALYAGLRYQEVFSGVAALSPVLTPTVVGDRLTSFIRATGRRQPMRIHVDLGTREPAFGPVQPLFEALREAGFPPAELRFRSVPGARHRVEDWGERFPEVLAWILPKAP